MQPFCDFFPTPHQWMQGDIGNIRLLDKESVSHTPYQPVHLPPSSLDFNYFVHQLSDASAELGKYNSLLSLLPNPDIMLRCLQSEEAVLSSRIDGTQATFNEFLMHCAGVEVKGESKRDDIQEITNYLEALTHGRVVLDKGYTNYTINLTLICELHKILMKGARGADKTPGEIRKVQNCVGHHLPPEAGQLPIHMDNWLTYLDSYRHEPLIQTALMHAQFELLYPFLGGNGRLGRILIPFVLWQKKCTSAPMFYLSPYLESNRDTYYQKLHNISEYGDWSGWVHFFMGAIAAQAKANREKIIKIKLLYEEMRDEPKKVTGSKFILNVLDAIFASPYFRETWLTNFGIPKPSAPRWLEKLEENGVLVSIRVDHQKTLYMFPRLLAILQNK